MVGPNNKRMLRALQPMLPLLQGKLDGQELAVADVIVSLWRGQPAGEEGTGVELVVGGGALGENRAHSGVRSVGLHHKLERGIRLSENGREYEPLLEAQKGGLRLWRPYKGTLGGGQGRKGCRDFTVASYESPIEVGEP